MTGEELIDRLDGVRAKPGGGWMARCPAHEDHTPSLSIDPSDEALLVHCFAGCSTDAIMTALGLTMADLFNDPRPLMPVPNGHAVTTWYDIRDRTGTLIARKKRVDTGGAKTYALSGHHGLSSKDLPLYGMELFDTWPATAPILLVEGEKAALALQTRGAYALGTVTGAAAIPSSIVLAPLANRRLVLWPDNDDPGVQHMTQLGKRLIEIGATCRWFTWTDAPGGGDAADYLVTRTLANLKIDLAQAYRWPVEQNRVKTTGITAAELQRKTFDPLRWMVEGIVPEGALLIAGRPKSKKSWLALGLGLAIAMNGRALGSLTVTPGRVLYLDLEGNQRRIQDRMRSMLGRESTPWPENFHLFTAGEWPEGQDALPALVQWFIDYPDTVLVVIDVLQDFRPAITKGENPYDYDRNTLKAVNQLAEAHHATIILVHHTRKMKSEDATDEISGTLGAPSAVSTYWVLSRADDGKHTILTPNGRDLRNDDKLALLWDSLNCIHTIDGTADQLSISHERQSILRVLADDRAHGPKEIAMAIGKTVNAVQLLLMEMLHAGQIDKIGIGMYARVPQK
jgi:hypothetical protein